MSIVRQTEKKTTALMLAVQAGSLETCTVLVNGKADVNAVDADSKSVLMWAVEGGNLEIIDLLLSHGADLSLAQNNGKTVLIRAAKLKNRQVIHLLLYYAFRRNQKLLLTELTCLKKLSEVKPSGSVFETAPNLLYRQRNALIAPFMLGHGSILEDLIDAATLLLTPILLLFDNYQSGSNRLHDRFRIDF